MQLHSFQNSTKKIPLSVCSHPLTGSHGFRLFNPIIWGHVWLLLRDYSACHTPAKIKRQCMYEWLRCVFQFPCECMCEWETIPQHISVSVCLCVSVCECNLAIYVVVAFSKAVPVNNTFCWQQLVYSDSYTHARTHPHSHTHTHTVSSLYNGYGFLLLPIKLHI